MEVDALVLTKRDGQIQIFPYGEKTDAFRTAVASLQPEELRRIAFRGRTRKGRGGVVLILPAPEVNGHKLEAIGAFRLEASEYGIAELQDAFAAFANGESVLIKTEKGEMLLRWNPLAPEVFAHGYDSAA